MEVLKKGLIIFIILRCMSMNSIFSPNTLNENDYKSFNSIGEQLFTLVDKDYIEVGQVIYNQDYENNSYKNYPEVEKSLSKYKDKVIGVYIVDKDVILLSFGATFQSVDGIAVTRNNAELEDTYEITGYDEGTLYYDELIPKVYHYTAGL